LEKVLEKWLCAVPQKHFPIFKELKFSMRKYYTIHKNFARKIFKLTGEIKYDNFQN